MSDAERAPIPFDAEPPLAGVAPLPPIALDLAPGAELWVFGYGSLMWDPGFPYVEDRSALIRGYHRSLCIWSHRYRGTPERPGLVLGLSPGGSCRGRAFRVLDRDRPATLDYLHRREMLTATYRPLLLKAATGQGTITALTFVPDRQHKQYCAGLSEAEQVAIICAAHGARGPNRDYLINTVAHLDELGIAEGALHRLLELVQARL